MNKSRADRCVTHHHACDCREYEVQERIQQLESKLYDAYGLGIDDGIDMETHPHGLGGKTRREVLAALLKENDNG